MSELKETKEAVLAGLVIGLSIYKEAKDGVQAGKDVVALVNDLLLDEGNRSKIAAGIDGLLKISAEVKEGKFEDYIAAGLELFQDYKALKASLLPEA
jgi:hypothetical protein